MISVVISTSAVLALAAANRYSFQRLILADLAIAFVAAAGAVSAATAVQRSVAAPERPGRSGAGGAGVLAVLSAFRVRHRRQGPRCLHQRGDPDRAARALVLKDPVVASVPPFARDLFFPGTSASTTTAYASWASSSRTPTRARLSGSFRTSFPRRLRLATASMDSRAHVGRSVSGPYFGVLAVYFAGRRLVGTPAALAAATLLTLNVAEVWFSRYPNTELAMQAVLFAALLASARAHVDRDAFFAPVSAPFSACCCFCVSTPSSALPACSRPWRWELWQAGPGPTCRSSSA